MSDINVFTDPTPNQEQGTLDSLVGEGRKYANAEELARSWAHAQEHIKQLEAETAQYRNGIQTQVEQLRQPEPVTPPSEVKTEQRAPEVDLETRIRETIEKTERDKKLARNVNEVSTKLVEVYGSAEKANAVVKARAAELGVSLDFLMEAAAQSPRAFYAQVGLNDGPRSTPLSAVGSVNPSALTAASPNSAAQPGTYKYYEQLRKENPKLYNKPSTQLQMHKDAMTHGERFFT